MHRDKRSMSVVAALRGASVLESELLNSERIERRFGNYAIDVVDSNEALRRSNLYSLSNGVRVCRTFAVVRFGKPGDELVAPEHAEIVAGRSIGAIFKTRGWEMRKKTLFTGELRLDGPDHPVAGLMCLDAPTDVAMHVYRLLLEKGNRSVDYATITEVHHPDYLGHADLRRLYPLDADAALDASDVERLIALVAGR